MLSLDADCKADMPDYTIGVATDNCGVTVTQDPIAGTQCCCGPDRGCHTHRQRWQRKHC
ncbi:MAG: hypothetical protein MZV63_56090 [Marinilabiliales bacterium]|nr:hypothetical protein [Marinilabiliales bacterium]